MNPTSWFEDVPVVGKMSPRDASIKLRELGEDEVAAALETVSAADTQRVAAFGLGELLRNLGLMGPKPWQNTAHAFGYIPEGLQGSEPLPISHAGTMPAVPNLKNARLKITLDRFRVAEYPGSGKHQVLFDFYAKNQVAGNVEHLHFNATFPVQEGQHAAILGFPIFKGLNVGKDGVEFKCFTVNVKNDEDEKFLSFLETDLFREGLQLAQTLQPAIAPLSGMALALTKAIASRNRNVPVQDIYMGLDFSNIVTRARLAVGSYIAVQIPETVQTVWTWSDWVYHPQSGQVVSKTDLRTLIPYNYLIFGISPYEED